MYDVLLKNGRIVDGSGAPWFYGDVAIKDSRIVEIGKNIKGEAIQVIDVKNNVISPGFIDAHSHSDFPLLINNKAESKIRMGVTTEVVGQCGSSAAPYDPEFVGEHVHKNVRYTINFITMEDYLLELERNGVAVNVVPLIGHGTIRQQVMGLDKRVPTADELAKMKKLVAKAMEDGAIGFSSGLIYIPSKYAQLDELIEIAKVVNDYGGIYATHVRNERQHLLSAIQEAIEIGRRTGISVQISHFKAMGQENWGSVNEAIEIIEQARLEGIDVTMDQYPYIATSTGLRSIIPPQFSDGGTGALRKRLKDPEIFEQARKAMEEGPNPHEKRFDWIYIASCFHKHNQKYEGKNLLEIAAMTGKSPATAGLELLLDEGFRTSMVRFAMCEEDVETVMRHPLVMIGSDGSALANSGPLNIGVPHPRNYGTFVRVLAEYVRERRVLTLEEAVRKMTSLPASRFKLNYRGLIKLGFYADIVVFNPDTVKDQATFTNPHVYATGIEHVLVNGKVVIENTLQNDNLPGKVLRRN